MFAGALVAMALIDLPLLGLTLAVIAVAVVSVVVASARIQMLTPPRRTPSAGSRPASSGRCPASARSGPPGRPTARSAGAGGGRRAAPTTLGVRIARIGAVLWPVSGLAIQGAFLAVLGVGGYRVAAGTLSVADLVTFIIFLFMMLMPLGTAFSAVATVRSALGALARIQEILDLPPESDDDAASHPTTAGWSVDGRVTSAADARRPAARLRIRVVRLPPRRARAAGRELHRPRRVDHRAWSGRPAPASRPCSRSLERFYDPDDGTCRLDGVDVRALPRADAARPDRLRGAGRAGAGRDDPRQPPAGRARRRRRRLPARARLGQPAGPGGRHADGLDTEVGDDGVGLSGGERQRLAIARALLAGAPLLLLDEPTASLDGRNERAMQLALRTAARGRTVLIVAHRLATVVGADQIVVLDAGRVVGVGTHAELLAENPLYRELAAHQLLV